VDRLSGLDAGFYFAESENTPMHVGSVTVFEGPAPSYGDIVRLLLSKLPVVPRYRQRVREVPLQLARPLWLDDPHFNILYHVRHTAVPGPGSDEQLRNLAGRVLGQRLDMAKPLWEFWLVEGLADNRWAIISKVHHCMVDGVAGTDLMTLMFDLEPDAKHDAPEPWTPERTPSNLELVTGAVSETVAHPIRQLPAVPSVRKAVKGLVDSASTLAQTVPSLAKQAVTPTARSLNGPIGPHRRWAWTDGRIDEFKAVRTALGGTVNDVILTAITSGFRDLLAERGELSSDKLVVRSMVPVSVRRDDEKGAMDNRVSAVFVDLPVGQPDPKARLAAIRGQMDEYKKAMQAVDVPSIIAMGDFVAPALLSLGVRAVMQAGQLWCQAVTTNVPGPNFPLYVLGRKMQSANAYVPIAGGTRLSIGIFSYLNTITFGINADFDAFPDVDVLSEGIRRGIDELVALAAKEGAAAPAAKAAEKPATEKPADKPTTESTPAKKAPARKAPAKKATAATPPAKKAPAKKAPAKSTAAAATPAKSTPAKATPAKSTAADSTPAKSTPAKSTPANATPAKSTPATSTAADSTPAKSTPAKSTPAKATPAKSTPASTATDSTPATAGAR
jgi:diacylglycerol O-acyltransferase